MAKKDGIVNDNAVKSVIDRTDQKWYVKKGTNIISFCDSVEDFLDGKSEKSEFIEVMKSQKFIINTKKEEVEKNDYFIFVIKDNAMVLVRSYNKIR